MAKFTRGKDPGPFAHYSEYKQPLRKQFEYRCVYCTLHEGDMGGYRDFCVEHFRPKSKPEFVHLSHKWENLYYACSWCNTWKSDTWPSDELIRQGQYFIDACQEDLYTGHVRSLPDGELQRLTPAGVYTVDHIRLNRKFLKKIRRRRHIALERKGELLDMLHRLSIEKPEAASEIGLIEELLEELEKNHLNPPIPYDRIDQV